MKYRLALKLAAAGHKPDGQPTGGAIGWAVLKLGHPKTTGADPLPYPELDGPGEARIVVYERTEDMFEPMPMEQFEQRIITVIGTLPEDCAVIKVPFDRVSFSAWLAKNRKADSHESRAEWANCLTLHC